MRNANAEECSPTPTLWPGELEPTWRLPDYPPPTIDLLAPSRQAWSVTQSTMSLPRYLFTGRGAQLVRHLPSFARLYWRLFRDRRVSVLPKALLVLIGLYVFSPIDIVPDFVPVIGALDDLTLGLAGLWLFVQLCPPPVVREHVVRIAAESVARA